MILDPSALLLLAALFAVAALYSSVGHGGASGYMAVMIVAGAFSPKELASTALLLNLLVSALAWHAFRRAGFFSWKEIWPFLAASVPAAFAGGYMKVPPHVYAPLLGAALLFAAARMLLPSKGGATEETGKTPPLSAALALGAGIGLLSGMVGVGGGIFLSPLLLLFGWAGPKRAAAASAAFIWINSASGIGGRIAGGNFEVAEWLPFMAAAFAGGLLGSYMGAFRLPGAWVRRLLGVVLLVAAAKMLWVAFFG